MFCLLALWIVRLLIMLWYPSWDNVLFHTAEFFFNAFMILLYSFQIIIEVTNIATYSENFAYIFFGAICILQICIIKLVIRKKVSNLRCVKEEEAIILFKNLVSICIAKKKENLGLIFNVICNHRQSCARPFCLCNSLIVDYQNEDSSPVYENKKAFNNIEEVPSSYTSGFFMKSLKILTDDIVFSHGGSTELLVLQAELSYYYFGNHYGSLAKLLLVQERKPNIFISQSLYNLRNKIAAGLNKNYDKVFDREKTLITIDYLETFRKFLAKSENMIELTVQFWSILLQEKPTAQNLSRIGAKLFKSKQKLIRNIGEISKITVNHAEFLLRYGLILKAVMQDYSAADAIFRKLEYLTTSSNSYSETSKFSIFNSGSKVMFILASFMSESDASINQVNTEVEKNLMYKYDEIIGRSITMLMPPHIASIHSKFVQKFFLTMESNNIGCEIFHFIKSKSGLYIPCKLIIKVVPRMNNYLQAAIFMIKDSQMLQYSTNKPNTSLRSVGAILCDDLNKIIGFTKEAINILKLQDQNINDLSKHGVLEDVFPQLSTSYVKNQIKEKEGCVIKFSGLQLAADNTYTTDNVIRSEENDNEKAYILVWVRYVEEIYSENEKLHFVIFSKINDRSVKLYSNKNPGRELLFTQKIIKEVRARSSETNLILNPQNLQIAGKDEATEFQPYADNESVLLFDDNASVSQTANSDSRTQVSNNFMRLTHYLHEAEMSKNMPTSIKRLSAGIVLVLIGIITIISIFETIIQKIVIGMYILTNETNLLQRRFSLIEAYLSRNSLNFINAVMASIYFGNLARGETVFNSFLMRASLRNENIAKLHNNARRIMFELGIDFDSEEITIPDISTGNRTVTFSHAQIIVFFVISITNNLKKGIKSTDRSLFIWKI